MTVYHTGNPLGSAAAKDLFDNAQNFDFAINDITNAIWQDRFGRNRQTWYGLEQLAKAAIASFGYITLDSFQAGATLTLPNYVLRDTSTGEYYRWDGAFPKNVPAGSTPASSGGISLGAWLGVGDAVLRGNLRSDVDGMGDALVAVKQPFTGSATRTQHAKNSDAISAMDVDGMHGDGINGDTPAFAALEAEMTGRVIDLCGRTYKVDGIPNLNTYINGSFLTNSLDNGLPVTVKLGSNAAVISDTSDTGSYEPKYLNPLTGDYQVSGRSTKDLYALVASQNSRSAGPARAVNVGSIYSYTSGNISGNYSARQCRATVPQSVNIGSEDCRVDGGFRGSNLSSITSHATGETGVNIGSRRGWTTSMHAVNIASVDANAGGGRGAVLKAAVSALGVITSVTIVDGGAGYSSNATITFYDRLSQPSIAATATYTIDPSTGAILTVTVTNGGAGYTTTTDPLYETVQVIALEAGNYSANIATANNCATYGELSFNLGANNSSAKANRSGNIAASSSSTSAQYAVNIGSTSAVASATYAINIGSATSNATGANSANYSCTSSTASNTRSVNIGADTSTNSGIGSAIVGGGGNTITVDNAVMIAGNNSTIDQIGSVLMGRRVKPRSARSVVFGDSGSGLAATANLKFELLSNGNVNIAGSLAQNVAFTDIAKMFENTEAVAIPVGAMVAWEGRQIRPAKKGDIQFSAHSRTYAVLLGDSAFTWAGRYPRDEFGEIITGQIWDEEAGGWDESLNNGEGGYKGAYVEGPLENPAYDPTKEQIPRSDRRNEWTPVALLGEVHVRVNASVVTGDYIQPSDEPGLGEKSEEKTSMRCMEIRTPYDEEKGYAVALCLVM